MNSSFLKKIVWYKDVIYTVKYTIKKNTKKIFNKMLYWSEFDLDDFEGITLRPWGG